MHVHLYICIYLCIYAYIFIYSYICMYMYMCIQMRYAQIRHRASVKKWVGADAVLVPTNLRSESKSSLHTHLYT